MKIWRWSVGTVLVGPDHRKFAIFVWRIPKIRWVWPFLAQNICGPSILNKFFLNKSQFDKFSNVFCNFHFFTESILSQFDRLISLLDAVCGKIHFTLMRPFFSPFFWSKFVNFYGQNPKSSGTIKNDNESKRSTYELVLSRIYINATIFIIIRSNNKSGITYITH